MKYNFSVIEYHLIDAFVEIEAFDESKKVSGIVRVWKCELMEQFGGEFLNYEVYKFGNYNHQPEYKPSGNISLREWYQEHMSKAKAWTLWNEYFDRMELIEE